MATILLYRMSGAKRALALLSKSSIKGDATADAKSDSKRKLDVMINEAANEPALSSVPDVISGLISGSPPSKSVENSPQLATPFSSAKSDRSSVATLRRLVMLSTKGDADQKDDQKDTDQKNTDQKESLDKSWIQDDPVTETSIESGTKAETSVLQTSVSETSTKAESSTQIEHPANETSWYSWDWGSRRSESQPKGEAPSWYSYFYGTKKDDKAEPVTVVESAKDSREPSKETVQEPDSTQSSSLPRSTGSSWAFWSKSSGQGELAVSGTPSEDHPRNTARPDMYKKEQLQPQVSKKPKKTVRPNLVEPTTNVSYPIYSRASYLRSTIRRMSEYMLPGLKNPQLTVVHPHLYRTAPVKIRKVVVIGVHGYFPARLFRTIMGEPTGTSLKFASEAESAVQRWAHEKGYTVETEKIALDGEGRVMYRVESLYKLLLNWLNLIEEADFVFFAAHSQGTPVAVHLMAKLVDDGHVKRKHLALLGMAGISLGPISGLDQKLVLRAVTPFENDSLSELFQFQNLASELSKSYTESLRTILANNAKIAFIGSMNDQLVPLYSAICCHISHPNIYRAVYVDGQDVAPEFISNLISLALRLRNYGSTDHGVVKELSGALAGTLTGGGHSKIYDETRVYDQALRHALETTNVPSSTPLLVDTEFTIPKPNQNPYLLPWCLRGLLSEATARPSFYEQLHELYEEFESWNPESKTLKDVKYRLSAIKHSKL